MRVALIGTSGHGMHHRRKLTQLPVETVAMADIAGVVDPPDGVATFTDHRAMLAAVSPDVVIICTPPPTHLPIASDCLRAGADILMEKPPVLSLAQHAELQAVLDETGRACQVGFQALGSHALPRLAAAMTDGTLGEITAISAYGAWQRDDAYWGRSAWSGRAGTLDGALANPFAHALMQCLALAGARPEDIESVEVERFRARPIEVEDTGFLRVRLHGRPTVLVAVTLCGEEFVAGSVLVRGTKATAELEYPTDRLTLGLDTVPLGRTDLLINLLDHRTRGVPLLAPLAATAAFTAVIERLQAAPPPQAFAPHLLTRDDAGHIVVTGINAAVRAAARSVSLASELPTAGHPTERGLQLR
ncbi:Gfo/Idh/MocA family protein [Hamadaea tsunoensis]|uniref:Gfo/Idh/MocA family protein n=1 Tax=Hamadaea tsunoensis TaxID=53368 RepID=UPI0004877EF0|nr:Gfo/Idh/MocA family oxidoreductase [Hamadaea tsunoensis]